VKDGYCNQHHPNTIAAKDAASKAKQDAWSRKFILKRDVHHGDQDFTDAFRSYMDGCQDSAEAWDKVLDTWKALESSRAALEKVSNDE